MLKNHKFFILLIFLIGGMASPLIAQVNELSFDQAVAIGMKENLNLKLSRNTLYSLKSQKLTDRSAFLPNLLISGTAGRTQGQQINPVTGVGGDFTNDLFFASISARMPLFQGNSRLRTMKASKLRYDAQQALVSRTTQNVIYDVATQFLQVLLDQELLIIAQENLKAQQVILDEITGFVVAGARPESDRYTQEADVKNFELLVIQANNSLNNDKATLSQTLQLDPAGEFKVIKPDWDINRIKPDDYTLDSLYSLALERRPDLAQLKNNEAASEQDVRGAISGYLPSFNLGASYSSQYINPNDGSGTTPSFQEQFVDLNPQWQYGFTFIIPIFDRLKTRNNRIQAKISYDNSKNDRINLEKTIKIEVKSAYLNFIDVVKGYEVSQAQTEASKLAYETQSESYKVGIATQVERSTANQTYLNALASLAQNKYRLLFQKLMLDYATGTLDLHTIN